MFTLAAAAESMERESLDVGITSVLEALDHAKGALCDVVVQGALCDVVVPSSQVFA